MLIRDEVAEAFDSKLRGLPLPRDRSPQGRRDIALPSNLSIISCDNHWSSDVDVFFERFPAHLRHKAPRPRITNDGTSERFIEWEIEGQSLLNDPVRRSFATFEGVPGASDMKERLGYLDTEGIEKEIVFGNGINVFLGYPELDVREWIFRIYNEHLAELQALAPGRFYGAGNLIYWDMDKVQESVRQIKDLGIKTISLPMSPKGAGGVSLNYCAPEMDPLWGAIAEAQLPVCFHIGEFWRDGPGAFATAVMVSLGPFRQTMGELIFGGIFDRHPALRVVFLEAEINWIPGALQTASMLYECFMPLLDPKIKRHPREYWHENCYAGFIHDPAGLAMLSTIGADRVMWSADFPHQESSYGFTWSVIEEVLAIATEDEARMILGGTAQQLFKLD